MRLPLLALACALVATAPAAAGAPACADATELDPEIQGRYYVAFSMRIQVWEETNGLAGLQKTDCVGAGGALVRADAYSHDYKVVSDGCVVTINGWHFCVF